MKEIEDKKNWITKKIIEIIECSEAMKKAIKQDDYASVYQNAEKITENIIWIREGIEAIWALMNLNEKLDLEKLADRIIRVEYPTYERAIPQLRNSIIRLKQQIKYILQQHLG